jgi:hypothetical protein
MPQITVFKNIHETDTPFYSDVDSMLGRIRNGKSKDLITRIRKSADKKERNSLKKNLPSICFSGTFRKRADSALIEHSGFICLDFDGYKNRKAMLSDKKSLSGSAYVYSVFISPSDEGLKALIRVPPIPENHVGYFNALEAYLNNPHFDTTSKNISRVCYESYDPQIYINPDSKIWDTVAEVEYKEVSKNTAIPTIPITDENKIVDILVRWWQKKYPMSEGQRNHNVFILAAAMNDFGVNKMIAESILFQFQTSDFPESEIKNTINSAYKDTSKFGSKYYEDEERMNNVRAKKKRGASNEEIENGLKKEGLPDEVVKGVLTQVEKEEKNPIFWTKTDKGVVKIVHFLFKAFLEDHGFFKFSPEGSKSYIFVRVTNNLVDHTSEGEIKDFVLEYLLDEVADMSVYNAFADQTRFFGADFLSLLATIDIYFVDDTREKAYIYYRNCAVVVTKNSATPIDYFDLGGYVWKDQVIDRSYKECTVSNKFDFKRFIANICANNKGRIKTMESTIGFLLHGFKDLSYCPSVILNDEIISDNPEGGTGKGLVMNAIGHMKKLVLINGKDINFDRAFTYQLVSADTQVLLFDDVRKNFMFERLFSVITEGITLEKKNKDAIRIPFGKSPKIAITTNYAIKGTGNSFERRKWELELHQYYTKNFTPYDEFGRMLFNDWDQDLWCQFDNYMIECLQIYMTKGLIKGDFVNLNIRQLSAQTSHDFIEWCGLINDAPQPDALKEGKVYKNELYLEFISEYPDYGPKAKMSISRTRFYRWVTDFCRFKYNADPREGRDSSGRFFEIYNGHKKDVQKEIF